MKTHPVQVKICGITNVEDARLAHALGADAIGLNFYPKSPRYISPDNAAKIVRAISGVKVVGVFVNSTADEIVAIASSCALDVVQLHGDETADLIEMVRGRATVKVMKAIRVTRDLDPLELPRIPADEFLLDSSTESFGGSGKAFDWSAAAALKSVLPRFYLAGGLTTENVASAIQQVRPWGVDVCSGVEKVPGVKDPEKLRRFIKEARSA